MSKNVTLVISVQEIEHLLARAEAGSVKSCGEVKGQHTECITFALGDRNLIHTHRVVGTNPFHPALTLIENEMTPAQRQALYRL